MNLKSLKRKDVMRLADSNLIFERGEDYYESGAIFKFSVSPHEITAKVSGNYGDYTVSIDDASGELETDCNCPYDGYVCKHIVAVLLRYLEGEHETVEDAGPEVPDALDQALREMPHQELLEMVLKLAGERADFRRVLLANVQISPRIINRQPRNPFQVKRLKKEITDFFNEFEHRSHYDDNYYDDEYDEDEEYPELEPVFETALTLNPEDQVEVFWHVLTCGNDMFEEYPIGTEQIEKAAGLYAEAVGRLNLGHEEKRPYFDLLLDALGWDMCDYGDIEDALKNALDTICTDSKDYSYLIGKFKKSKHSKANDWIAGYYLKLGDEESYLRVRQKNLETEAQYVELAEYWKSKGDEEKYVATLESWVSALQSTRDDRDSGYYYYGLKEGGAVLTALAEIYKKRRDPENLCRILMAKAEYEKISLNLYKEIEALAEKTGNWEELQSKLLELAKRDTETLAEIYLHEEDWEAALQLAKGKGIYERVRILVADGVKEHHPEEAIKIYEKLVQHNIDQQSRKYYKSAAHYAGKIKSIYLSILKDEDAWQRYIGRIRTRYPRHRALQDEFRGL
ncbi:MAG: SWIM zinc finger family protein [Blastocatellia bacterium]|nr:SWIM zinc finger family protein [Blastocatellia bacterium]